MAEEPDDDVHLPWFPDQKLLWRLDVVTLLAVIGESSMEEHSQAITASAFCLLPRLIPAPQAFLKASRPARMPEHKATATGVHSGVTLDSVSFFAKILVPLDLKPFEFQALHITHTDLNQDPAPAKSKGGGPFSFLRRRLTSDKPAENSPPDIEKSAAKESETTATTSGVDDAPIQNLERRNTLKDKVTKAIVAKGTEKPPAVPAQLYSPLHMLTILSFLMSLAIVGAAVAWRDGTAIVAVSLMSSASSIVGYASWWQPRLMSLKTKASKHLPDGDIMIRTREGAFIYVKCDEAVARELFSGTEECRYSVSPRWHNALMAFGTMILMLAVVLLGNCKWNTQVFIAGAYISLNGLYWGLGMLPGRWSWDLSRYHIKDITPVESQNANKPKEGPARNEPGNGVARIATRIGTAIGNMSRNPSGLSDSRRAEAEAEKPPPPPRDPEHAPSFTRTLWYAIREAKSAEWVKRSKSAPETALWDEWIKEAHKHALQGNREWRAVSYKDELMKKASMAKTSATPVTIEE